MLNPNEIDPKHLPSLQAALLNHRSKLDEHLVSKLYKIAKGLLLDPKTVGDSSVISTRVPLESGVVLATCTDVRTGLFVQFAGDPKGGNKKTMLTFGQKFCQEHLDVVQQNIATHIW